MLAVLWGALEYYGFLPDALGGDAFGRAKGPFKDANVFAPFLVPVALHTVDRMLRARGAVLGFEAAKFLILTAGLLLAFSRGGWLNLIAAFGLFVLFRILSTRTMRDKARLVMLVAVLTLAAVSALSWTVRNTAAGQQFSNRATVFHEYDLARGGRLGPLQRATQRP